MRVSVGAKMTAAFGLVLILLGGVLLSGLSGLNRVVGIFEGQVVRIANNVRLSQEVATHVMTSSFSLAVFLSTGEPSFRSRFDAADQAAVQALESLRSHSVSQTALDLIDRVQTLQAEYVRGAGALFDLRSRMDEAEYLEYVAGLGNGSSDGTG